MGPVPVPCRRSTPTPTHGPRDTVQPHRAQPRASSEASERRPPASGNAATTPARDSYQLPRSSTRARVKRQPSAREAPDVAAGKAPTSPVSATATSGVESVGVGGGDGGGGGATTTGCDCSSLVSARPITRPTASATAAHARALERARRRPVDAAQLERRLPMVGGGGADDDPDEHRRDPRRHRRQAARDVGAHGDGLGAARGCVPAQIDRQGHGRRHARGRRRLGPEDRNERGADHHGA